MKILHVINTLSAGGAELHLLTLCRRLKKQNVDLVVACLREQVKSSASLRPGFENEDIKVVHLQADSRYDSRFFGKVARLLTDEHPDILHTHLPRADLAGAFARLLNPSLVWVCSVHGIYSNDWSGRWSLPLFDLLWRRADAMICISHAVQDWLIKRGMSRGKARVVHYGIEPERFAGPTVDFRQAWGLNGRAVVGSIGRLEPGKNHECLISAMVEICKAVPNALLLIAGHDPWGYGKNLHRLVENLGLEDSVRLIGFQSDVVSFLHALDVFAFASNSEGFGQVLVEAMAAGKPVVASEIPPLTEIVVEGESGLLVERGNPMAFAEALTRLLIDPLERERMGMRGGERVRECFTAERMSQETILLYDELLRRRPALRSIA